MMDGDDMDEVRQKLKDACDRFGLDEDGEDVEEEEETPEEEKAESSLVVWAAATTTFDGQAPSQIVYMPKGEWTITPRVNGEPKEVTVTVNQQTAARLQNDFEKRLAQPVRPTGGFDHKPGKASFIPKGFQWDESKGVILNIDWTRAGKDAIEGRDYSYFSPTFLLSDNNRVNGLTKRGEIGSLTNNPAFEQIERIAASADDPDDNPDPDDYMMSTLTKKLREFQIITAQEAEEPEAVVQAVMALNTELVGARAANAALRNENTVLKTEVERVKAKEADSVIEAAIAEGRIPGKDAKLVGYWKAQLIAQPETVKEVIASLPANPALKPLIEVKAGDSKAGISRKIGELVERQKRVVNEIAASQGISHTQAFNKAREERPDLFPAEL
jgi:phage I-like protein